MAMTHRDVKLSRKDIRRPTRSLIAPRTGEIAAFSPTLMAVATPYHSWPSLAPSRSTAHSDMAYDTTA